MTEVACTWTLYLPQNRIEETRIEIKKHMQFCFRACMHRYIKKSAYLYVTGSPAFCTWLFYSETKPAGTEIN